MSILFFVTFSSVGVTCAVFKTVGKVSSLNDRLKRKVNGSDMIPALFFIIFFYYAFDQGL